MVRDDLWSYRGDSIGSFFSTKHLSRALAKLDWNRDGLVDFAVSNILEPATLVTKKLKTQADT
jgi:hypothetical protein